MAGLSPSPRPRPGRGREGVPAARHLRLVPDLGVEPDPVGAQAEPPARVGGGSPRPAPLVPEPLVPAPRRSAPLRLTRRGRLLVFCASLAAVLALVAGLLAMADRVWGAQGGVGGSSGEVVGGSRLVLPGETLWSISLELAPEQDPRDTVAALVAINDLPGPGVAAGQRLLLPAGLSDPAG